MQFLRENKHSQSKNLPTSPALENVHHEETLVQHELEMLRKKVQPRNMCVRLPFLSK